MEPKVKRDDDDDESEDDGVTKTKRDDHDDLVRKIRYNLENFGWLWYDLYHLKVIYYINMLNDGLAISWMKHVFGEPFLWWTNSWMNHLFHFLDIVFSPMCFPPCIPATPQWTDSGLIFRCLSGICACEAWPMSSIRSLVSNSSVMGVCWKNGHHW